MDEQQRQAIRDAATIGAYRKVYNRALGLPDQVIAYPYNVIHACLRTIDKMATGYARLHTASMAVIETQHRIADNEASNAVQELRDTLDESETPA